ncbi:bifunctional indole-3-glycerol phosphate synthase/phosphoribosylanthranilate isomerase, partial [Plesiomonas shigelloides]|nr:bifunctional indole-3-glycerol phosphate synthase/phosphoribosylanthranilate isomerase [Plesiomonas shigelloides]
VDIATAKTIQAAAPLQYVGVLRNAKPETITLPVERLGLHALQLHGSEDAASIHALRPTLPTQCQIWKALPVGAHAPKLDLSDVDRSVLDSEAQGQFGGTGRTFHWAFLEGLPLDNVFLSGGLNPDNAESAQHLGAAALAFNSVFESAP